jgi:hypothetical protein
MTPHISLGGSVTTYPNIALIGKARSGKDTVAARLIATRSYTRVAFADPLKEMALALDPLIPMNHLEAHSRLSLVVEQLGWEYAKDNYPEIRRVLQHLGSAVRDQDEDFWLQQAMNKVWAAYDWNLPVVVTDCRYRNEADELREAGFMLVRIERPTGAPSPGADHASETELDYLQCDAVIGNVGTLDELYAQVDKIVP